MTPGFTNSMFDKRMYLFKQGSSFIIITIVVDDIAIASKDAELLTNFKNTQR